MNIEQAKELQGTDMWRGFCEEVDRQTESFMQQMRKCEPGELRDLQIRIQTLERVKRIPQDVVYREEKGDEE